jgi:hypothetical protein
LSLSEARALGDEVIDTEHLLLGLIRDRQDPVVQILVRLGCDLDELRQAAIDAVPVEDSGGQARPRPQDGKDQLRAEIARLRRLLGRHGIDPDEAM